ncbi:unnamed protein product [Aphis gossypii]|uniref:Uncharacterized protein n=1 Tax=Aphis gossypii TaxID=80765 RepID=A0A9P0N8K7_APHGO|nr:unnamed protein product [Aphis gossypii]
MRFITLLTRYSGPLPCFCVHCILYRLWVFIGPGKRGERIIQDSQKPISLGSSNLYVREKRETRLVFTFFFNISTFRWFYFWSNVNYRTIYFRIPIFSFVLFKLYLVLYRINKMLFTYYYLYTVKKLYYSGCFDYLLS